MRAFWIPSSSMSSTLNIRRAISSAVSSGYDAVIAPLAIGARSDSDSFDAGEELLREARERGVAAHLSVTVNMVASADELPASRDHVIYQHPEWLMVPRQIATEMLTIDARSPAYLGRMARWTRANVDRVAGLYVSPLDPAATQYLVNAVVTAVGRYAVDGVFLDAVEFPGEDFDYSRETLEAFRRSIIPDLSDAERGRYEARAEAEPLLYTRAFPERWRAFRVDHLTDLLTQLRETVRTARPGAVVSAAVAPDPVEAARRLQDWPAWLAKGLIDVVCPMASTTDSAAFASQMAAAREAAGRHPLWVGIGASSLSHEQIMDDILAARRIGAGGVGFSYDSLTAPARGSGYLSRLGKAAFSF